MIRGVLFDIDGTLFDIDRAWSRLEAHNTLKPETDRRHWRRTIHRYGAFNREAAATLDSLMSGWKLGILSNGSGRVQRRKLSVCVGRMADRFDVIHISGETGRRKPCSKAFTEAVEALELTPEEVLHVGDDPELDGRGATTAGLEVVLIGDGDHEFPRIDRISDLVGKLAGEACL